MIWTEKVIQQINWGYSSAGRAVALQAKGHRFDPVYLHQTKRGNYVTRRSNEN